MSTLAALARHAPATDGQLLGRFVKDRDAEAFAALVRRLGPTVLAVCRRVCPDSHLAEDAFQAAFLVLARKAEAVRPREQVAVWLHGVAYRTASKARAMLSARRRREVGSTELPDPPATDVTTPDADELRQLDAAIAALPEKLRAAVVLCELDGRSRKDAAKQLGIPEGTLSSRLADARKRLGDRLRPTAATAVSLTLAARTAEAAVSGVASQTVRSLARGVLSMMLLHKVTLSVVAALFTAAALSGAVFAADPPRSEPKPVQAPAPRKDEVELKWRLKKGDEFYVKHEFESDTRFTPPKVSNLPFPKNEVWISVVETWKVTVLSATADGVSVEVETLGYLAGLGILAKVEPTDEMKGVVGHKFKVSFDADFKVTKIEDGEALDKAIAKTLSNRIPASTALAARHVEQLFQLVPGKPTRKGEWERKGELVESGEWERKLVDLPGKKLKVTTGWERRAMVEEIKDDVAKVGVETDYTQKTDPDLEGLAFAVDLKGEKCEGTCWFDIRTGRVQKFEEKVFLAGACTEYDPRGVGYARQVTHTTTVSDKPFKVEKK